LEREVIPEFYARNAAGLPVAWVARIRESMAGPTPRFSYGRTVGDHTEDYYPPAAQAYRRRAADGGEKARELVAWRNGFGAKFGTLRFRELAAETSARLHAIAVRVFPGETSRGMIRVELYANAEKGGAAVRLEMIGDAKKSGPADGVIFRATVPADRPASDYTARIVDRHAGRSVPLEAGWIPWQK